MCVCCSLVASSVCPLPPPLFHPFVTHHLGCVSNTAYCSFNELTLKQQNKRVIFSMDGAPRRIDREVLFWKAELQSCGFNPQDSMDCHAGAEPAVPSEPRVNILAPLRSLPSPQVLFPCRPLQTAVQLWLGFGFPHRTLVHFLFGASGDSSPNPTGQIKICDLETV